jgi:hypothetical protein
VSNYTPISHQLISHEEALIQYAARSEEIKKFFTKIIDENGDRWLREYFEDQFSIYCGIIPLRRCDQHG